MSDEFQGFMPAYCQNGSCGSPKPRDYVDRGWDEVSGLLLCGTCVDAARIGIEQAVARVALILEAERDAWVKPPSFNYRNALNELLEKVEATA